MSDVVFGRVPKPPILELICAKPYDGAGFTRLAQPRKPVGVCEHITDGYGTVEWYSRFFGTGGQRQFDALVDFVVGRDGRIGMLNDPWGTRSPWANGGLDGMEGDGPAFLARFGVSGVNDRLISIEHEGRANDDWTPRQWDASVALDAWLFDQVGVRWDRFPVHQQYGVVVDLFHGEFTGKGGDALLECPGRYLKQNVDRFQAAIRDVMKAYQAVDVTVPTPEPPKPEPVSIYPKGMTEAKAKRYFGKMRDHTVSPMKERGFNAKGAISLAWLERGAKENAYPEARDRYQVHSDDGKQVLDIVMFGNGWLLIRRADRAGWQWV